MAPMASDRLKTTAIGLALSIYAPLAFLFPLDALLLFGFPRCVREGRAAVRHGFTPSEWDRNKPDWLLLLLHMTIGGFVLLIVGALATGASHYLERYMHPFFLPTPLWLLALVEQSGNAGRKVLVLATILFVGTALVVPVRALDYLNSGGPKCGKCRLAIPYQGLVETLKAQGIKSGTIIAYDRNDAGNLLRYFPDARIVCLKLPENYGPPVRAADLTSKVVVIWRPSGGKGLPRAAKDGQPRSEVR
jgi:hypothetical protein